MRGRRRDTPKTHLQMPGYTAAALQEKVSQSLQGAGNFPSMFPGSVKRIHVRFAKKGSKSPKGLQSGTSVLESNRWHKMLAHVLAPTILLVGLQYAAQ